MNAVDKILTLPQHLIPQHLLSHLAYRITRSTFAPLKNALIKTFIRKYDVDMGLALLRNPESYESFNAFFTRSLREDARPVDLRENVLCSPVDARISQCGPIKHDRLFQAKGRHFTLSSLLGEQKSAQQFTDGSFATLYLSPRDYHRIHMPAAGQLRSIIYIPGRLFSVNPRTTRAVDALFARNERVCLHFNGQAGPYVVILVGAIFVGSINTVWTGDITPPRTHELTKWSFDSSKSEYASQCGDELGQFNMGSTVILLFPKDAVRWSQTVTPDAFVKMGTAIGEFRI